METVVHHLEIRDLGSRGLEVVLTVVNQGEEPLSIRGAVVQVWKDERDLGLHPVSFKEGERILLDQFEIAEGHFHLPQETERHRLHFRVSLDVRVGDEDQTKRISRRMETGKFRRPSG